LTQINTKLKTDFSNEHAPTYHTLEQFSSDCLGRGVRLILVAMPLQFPYRLDPRLLSKVKDLGLTLLDVRYVEGLTASRFIDQMHMDHAGAILYTRTLAGLLADSLNSVRQAGYRTFPTP
jgi:hypothetical protein